MSIENLLTSPPALPLIGASILSADFANLGADAAAALDAGADMLHVDVMDGHFVPNLTLGPALCASLHAALPASLLDVHLMVTDPMQYIEPFASAGAGHLTFHVEAVDDPAAVAAAIHERGLTAGLALNPGTPVDAVTPWIDAMDLVLVMSVEPGFSGQAFRPEVLEKARQLAPTLRPNQRLQIDGGVAPATAGACREAGCDVLAAASAIFKSSDYRAAIESMRTAGRLVRGR